MKKLFVIGMFCCVACKESYNPPVIAKNYAYLTVEGFINNGPDSTLVHLSRTFPLNSDQQADPELNAKVSIVGTDNSSFLLTERGNGDYYASSLVLNDSSQYRLQITTVDNQQYRSDFVPLKDAPPIDSINWVLTDKGLQIYVNTHDPKKASLYYRWGYEQTWEFGSVYTSDTSKHFCWKQANSTNVLLGSSVKLSQDVIYEAPLVLIPLNSWIISIKYSIMVKQYVLTPEAYGFWQILQQNSEQIGSVFSPQPSTLKGNLHCVSDSTLHVFGYISAGTLRSQRIYITPDQLQGWTADKYPTGCASSKIVDDSAAAAGALSDNQLVIGKVDDSLDVAPARCADCTLTGSNVKPSFWP